MSTRRTSLEAYEYILTHGILSTRRQQAYDSLYSHGPMTAQELTHEARVPGLWKRLPELRELGYVAEVGERECSITGRTAILWDVTDKHPNPPRQAEMFSEA